MQVSKFSYLKKQIFSVIQHKKKNTEQKIAVVKNDLADSLVHLMKNQ